MLLTRTDVRSASALCVRAPPPARSGRDRLDKSDMSLTRSARLLLAFFLLDNCLLAFSCESASACFPDFFAIVRG